MNLRAVRVNDFGVRLFLTFCTLAPIFIYHGIFKGHETLRMGQEQFFQIGATVLFCVILLENVYLAAFMLWAIFLYAYYNFPQPGGSYVLNIFSTLIIYQVAYKLMSSEVFKKLKWALYFLVVLNLLWIFLQAAGLEFLFVNLDTKQVNEHLVGFFGLKAFMGMFFAMMIPIFLPHSLITLLLFVPVYFSECSVAMVGGIAAVLWFSWNNSKKAFYALLLILSILGGAYVIRDSKANMFSNRINLWKMALSDASVHPIIGMGLDSFRSVGDMKPYLYFNNPVTNEVMKLFYHKDTNSFVPKGDTKIPRLPNGNFSADPWDNPHNEYIKIFYEMGIIPFVILFFLIKDIVRRFKPSPELISIIGFFIVLAILCIGQFPLHVVRNGLFVPVFLAVYYKLTDSTDLKKKAGF